MVRFNPRAPCGARREMNMFMIRFCEFQSTRPVWGATLLFFCDNIPESVSIHAPRVGRDRCVSGIDVVIYVSIHAPRVGRDIGARGVNNLTSVSIHAPRVGRDRLFHLCNILFLVSIHAPRVGRDRRLHRHPCHNGVSIHAPRVGRDSSPSYLRPLPQVSIHAPRVGRDGVSFGTSSNSRSFNPRAPCGARRQLESRLPPFATYLWAFPSTNTIFSAPETHAPPAA